MDVVVLVENNAATPKSSQQVKDLHMQHSSKCTTIALSEQADKGCTKLANIPMDVAVSVEKNAVTPTSEQADKGSTELANIPT